MNVSSSMAGYIKEANTQLEIVTHEMASGEKKNLTSAEYQKKLVLEDDIGAYKKINQDLTLSKVENQVADKVMSEMKDIITSFKSKMILANTATTSDTDRDIIAGELRHYKDSIIDMANTEVMDNSLFAGSDKSVQAFSYDTDIDGHYTNISYEGSARNFSQEIGKGITKGQGLTGLELFDGLVDANGNQIVNQKGEVLNNNTTLSDKDGNIKTYQKNDIIDTGYTYVAPQFENNDFSNGSAGWSTHNTFAQAGITSIAGHTMPNDPTYPSTNSGSDEPGNNMAYNTNFDNEKATLSSSGNSSSYGVVRGPYIASDSSVELKAGATVSVTWAAEPSGDAYDVFGYIVNEDTGEAQIILNDTGTTTRGSGTNQTNSITVQSEGNYKFVFVSGSHDLSGGTVLGATLSIDDITITGSKPEPLQPKILYELEQAIEAVDANETGDLAGRSIGKELDSVSDDVFEKLNIQHANLGNKNAIFEKVFEQNEYKLHSLDKLLQETEGIDIAEASIKLQQLQLMFASIFSTLQEVNQIEQRLAEST